MVLVRWPRARERLCRSARVVATLSCAACLAPDGQGPASEALRESPTSPSRAAMLVEVNVPGGRIRVAPPTSTSSSEGSNPGFRPSLSILEGEAVGLQVDNMSVSEVGAFTPHKVRVQFDVSVANRLPQTELVPSSLGPGITTNSLTLFPLLQTGSLTDGTVTSSEDGTVLISRGQNAVVEASPDWNGDGSLSPRGGYDFGADSACLVPADGCSRWKALPPMSAGETSTPLAVGFDLDPSVSTFRAWLMLVADLRNDGDTLPPPPGVGVPFGPYSMFGLGDFDAGARPPGSEAFTLGMDSYSASTLLYRLVVARAEHLKLMLALTGGEADSYLTDGVFDLAKWRAKLDTYAAPGIQAAIAAGVEDGTIIGASVMDEPYNPKWGGVMTKSMVDGMCGYVKAMFPTLPTGVVHQHTMFEPNRSYHQCDFIVSQYGVRYGNVAEFRDSALAQGRRDGIAIAFSMNLLDGGTQAPRDGLWDCPVGTTGGQGTYEPNCRMTADQVSAFGAVLGPAGCAFLMWRYDPEFMADSANQRAFREIAHRQATLPSTRCTRSPS